MTTAKFPGSFTPPSSCLHSSAFPSPPPWMSYFPHWPLCGHYKQMGPARSLMNSSCGHRSVRQALTQIGHYEVWPDWFPILWYLHAKLKTLGSTNYCTCRRLEICIDLFHLIYASQRSFGQVEHLPDNSLVLVHAMPNQLDGGGELAVSPEICMTENALLTSRIVTVDRNHRCELICMSEYAQQSCKHKVIHALRVVRKISLLINCSSD